MSRITLKIALAGLFLGMIAGPITTLTKREAAVAPGVTTTYSYSVAPLGLLRPAPKSGV